MTTASKSINPETGLYYLGQGQKLKNRPGKDGQTGGTLPPVTPFNEEEQPENYIASDGLRHAVHVALTLGQPLLVTGEPGTGKTRLARSVAWELDLAYLDFHVKSASTAQDLFYQYDALLRFQDVQAETPKDVSAYLHLNALGKAILLSLPGDHDHRKRNLLPEADQKKGQCRSVVLLDEIDKAPRDLPNDALDEIEGMRFRIKEAPDFGVFECAADHRPLVILTSNSERSLPDAFLRRCVFYHIPFPGPDELAEIAKKRFQSRPGFTDEFLREAVDAFYAIRGKNLRKKPATGEFLAWVAFLLSCGAVLGTDDPAHHQWLLASCAVLAKNKDDEKIIGDILA